MTFAFFPTISRNIRINGANGVTGTAIINNLGNTLIPRKIVDLTRLKPENEENPLTRIFNLAKSFLGFLGGLVKAIGFSATKIWGWVVNGITRLKAFDWNASDAAIQQGIQSQNEALAGVWGGILGQGFGWLAGIAVGYGVAFLCPVIGGSGLARLVASRTAQEALEELRPGLLNALQQTTAALAGQFLLNTYMGYRRALKNAPRNVLVTLFGAETADFIQNVWGAKGGPNLSFNTQMDEAIEAIDNQALQNFLEEFFEEAWDGFTEAGFIVAQEIDEAWLAARANQQQVLGPERTIEITPDKDAPEEKITLVEVPQKLALPITQQVITQHRMLYNRDVGAIVGTPYDDWLRARPQLRQLTILFYERDQPPWRLPNGKPCKKAIATIPDVKATLSWQEIKTAASSFTWGKYYCNAKMSNARQMGVYGATAQEAKQKLLQLAQLSTAEILSISITEQETRPLKLRKEPTRMYPAYATLLARRNSLDGEGRVTLDNRTYDENVIRIPLWVPREPPNLPPLN